MNDDLSNEALVVKIREGGDVTGELILQLMKQNEGFALTVARPFVRARLVEAEELRSLSYFAFLSAVRQWDADAHAGGFLTLVKWFLQAELAEAANNNRSAPVSEQQRTRERRYRSWSENFKKSHERPPTDAEIGKGLHLTPAQLRRLRSALEIESAARLDGDTSLADFITDPAPPIEDTVVEEFFRQDLRDELENVMKELPKEERDAIDKRFFTDDHADADAASVSRALSKLRKPAIALRLKPYMATNFMAGTSWGTFKRTLTSKPEHVVLKKIEGEEKCKK